jgi:hypothetical protein
MMEAHGDPDLGPLAKKIKQLRALKLRDDKRPYDISEIAREASRLYRELQKASKVEELVAAGASRGDIDRALTTVDDERDVLGRQYLSDLIHGKRNDPPFSMILSLSLFFEVSTDFFKIGAEATELTRVAEREVAVIESTMGAMQHLNSVTDGNQLIGALMRGTEQGDPDQVANVLRLAVMALDSARKDQAE